MRLNEPPAEDRLAIPLTAPSEETLRMFEVAGEQMRSGDYQAAIRTYESYLDNVSDIPVDMLSSYFGDLGLAHLNQGYRVAREGRTEEANEHFTRAAFMFEQAAYTATYRVIASVANYYRILAHFASQDYGQVNAVGEQFLAEYPEAAVLAELLPEGAVASVKEILSVSYMSLAEQARPAEAAALREKGLRYAEEAIGEAPDRVIQPYYFTGVAAYDRGDHALAAERLRRFVARMEAIDPSRWDEEDRRSVARARSILADLEAPVP